MDNACYGCKERELGCHSTCEKYLKWREDYLEEKEVVRRSKIRESAYKSAKIEAVIKAKKKRNN